MKRMLTMGAAMSLILLGVACGDDAEDQAPAAGDPAARSAQAGTVLKVDTLAGAGPYLTDEQGRALYLLEEEPQGQSTCYDACAEEWPPFLAPQGTPTAGAASVQGSLIGTIQRRDGAAQVTYSGHALYYYHDDKGAGQTTGHDVTDQWGEWYLVRPGGEALGHGSGAGQ